MIDEHTEMTQRGSPGAEWAFDDVYRRRRADLVRLAYVTVQSLALAEELVQDAFAELYRRRDRVQSPEAYLRRSVVNRTTSWVRRRKVENRHPFEPADDRLVPQATADFVAMLAPLSRRQRAALFLRFHEDLGEAEIAEMLGCRPGTVKSLISRALARLREGLTDEH